MHASCTHQLQEEKAGMAIGGVPVNGVRSTRKQAAGRRRRGPSRFDQPRASVLCPLSRGSVFLTEEMESRSLDGGCCIIGASLATRWWRPCMGVAVCLSIDQGKLLREHKGVEVGGRNERGRDDKSKGAQLLNHERGREVENAEANSKYPDKTEGQRSRNFIRPVSTGFSSR
ncbi:hypothetical protein BHM03_00049113 [Ensete ventricosum]|nr:hypothetical protein BHM03_00049113 [Ensete ventricosum]